MNLNTVNTDTSTDRRAVTAGVFPGYAEARRAVEALRQAGFRNDQIGVIGPDDRASGVPPAEPTDDSPATRAGEGAGLGAAAGGLAGLGLGTAVAVGLISPLGPVVAGGTLVALIASTGGGAAVGAALGAMAALGLPEDEANWYAAEAEAGRVVVTVHAPNSDAARDILARHGATYAPRQGTSHGTAIEGNALPATPY
jgi:hypothetical protein